MNIQYQHTTKWLGVCACLCVLLFSDCNKRYWYRTKIDVPRSNKYSVEIHIENQSPEILSKEFTDAMHKAAAKGLKKYGYYETHVKSPRYIFTLVLEMDSFNQSKRHFDNHNIPHSLLLGNYNYAYGVGAIVFRSQLMDTRYGPKWSKYYDIYYFGEKRDISRSAGVVKFLIKTSEQKRYQY
jgi:hypothetical protein